MKYILKKKIERSDFEFQKFLKMDNSYFRGKKTPDLWPNNNNDKIIIIYIIMHISLKTSQEPIQDKILNKKYIYNKNNYFQKCARDTYRKR